MNDKTLLLVEDDRETAGRIERTLGADGYAIVGARSMAEVGGIDLGTIDAVILDRMLASVDSLAAIKEWRATGLDAPILILSNLATVRDRIEGLKAGADDYLIKPFAVEELAAKVDALTRMRARVRANEGADVLTCGSITVDRLRREARREGRLIALQPRELKLLEELALSPGRTVPRSRLLKNVWNLTFDPRTKLIESHVSRLRDKLAFAGAVDAIETVRGVGYRLRTDV